MKIRSDATIEFERRFLELNAKLGVEPEYLTKAQLKYINKAFNEILDMVDSNCSQYSICAHVNTFVKKVSKIRMSILKKGRLA